MTDLVERLREPIDPDDPNLWKVDQDRREAADEIERLRALFDKWHTIAAEKQAENERLKREYDPNVAPCDDAEFGMQP